MKNAVKAKDGVGRILSMFLLVFVCSSCGAFGQEKTQQESQAEREHRRQLLTADEVMRIDENEAIARTSNKYPMVLYKGYYNEPPKTYPVTPSLAKVYVEETEAAEDLAL